MADSRFCQKADLERAVGGASVLIELLDKDEDQVADDALVASCLDEGSLELASYIQDAVDLESLTEPYPTLLVLKSAACAAYWAWIKGSTNQAVPSNIVDSRTAAIDWAKDVALRKAGLGSPQPATSQPLEQAVKKDTDPWVSPNSPRNRFGGWS